MTSLHPPSFHRNDFSTCTCTADICTLKVFYEFCFIFLPCAQDDFLLSCAQDDFLLWGFAPRRAHVDLCTRMRTRTTPPFLRTCNARVCYGVVQCLPVKSPTIYRRNLRREKNDRLVSVHISIDLGDVW